jgi:hypothetical protein
MQRRDWLDLATFGEDHSDLRLRVNRVVIRASLEIIGYDKRHVLGHRSLRRCQCLQLRLRMIPILPLGRQADRLTLDL